MNRNYFFLYFLLLATSAVAQPVDLQGTYGYGGLGAESFTFVGADSFYYSGFFCTWGQSGRGTVQSRGDRLFFTFEMQKPQPALLPLATATRTGSGGVVDTVLIRCIDTAGRAVAYATIRSGLTSADLRNGTTADSSGFARLLLPRGYAVYHLEASAVSFSNARVTLPRPGNYTVTFRLPPHPLFNQHITDGRVWEYEMEYVSEWELLMRRVGSRGPFVRFKKKVAIGR
ncbi:carboxypeptidase-like regulatory domain-containing protein [Flaviaesturariibacter amylovorans]|uniref:Carboxypeptidase regulatory-like domain-containing protein n=1 Tax=Flaviaesturariibacter amylovorans TaxID=1084520 RepID=A0ABP8HTF1_9BACT